MKRILLASRNRKKARELADLLADLPYEVVSLDEYPECPDVQEDLDSFEANSEKKAREVSVCTGVWTVADDSGLMVDALDGEPGIYSARYGGLEDDESRNRLLLTKLERVPPARRTARFVCCATLFGDGRVLHKTRGECEGTILTSPRGHHGFGYDPVFQPRGMSSSMAELPPEEKHRISHRGKALAEIREILMRLA